MGSRCETRDLQEAQEKYRMEPSLVRMTSLTCLGRTIARKQGSISLNISRSTVQFSSIRCKSSQSFSTIPTNFESSCLEGLDSLVTEVYKNDMSVVVTAPKEKRSEDPLVLLFGWAGANHKNLSKYSEIYNSAGCTTVQYNLPSKYIFNYTNMVPDLMRSYMEKLEETQELSERPVLIHVMSDGGLMSYQVMCQLHSRELNCHLIRV